MPATRPRARWSQLTQREVGAVADTQRLAPDEAGLDRAVELLRDGQTVAFPTETVYGLGADATNGEAVARIFEAKGRPRFNPLIVHVPEREDAYRLINLPEPGLALAEAYWPGPLTLVAPIRPEAGIADLVSAGLPTLAVRVPGNPLAQALLQRVELPLAGPSANPSGSVSPTSAEHVLEGLFGRIAAVLDGGNCRVGLESTIIGFEGMRAVMLRPGGLPAEAIEDVLGASLLRHSGGINAPGQLESHYAPGAPMRLNAVDLRPDELRLGFRPGEADLNLSAHGDLREAAANLFAFLRELDRKAEGRAIAVAPIPDEGLGLAINDRLRRAAAPR